MHYQRVDRTLKSNARSPRRQYFQVTNKPSENQKHKTKTHETWKQWRWDWRATLFAQLRWGCVVTPLQKENQKIFIPLFFQPFNRPCIGWLQVCRSRNFAWPSPSRRISKTSCISSPHLNRCEGCHRSRQLRGEEAAEANTFLATSLAKSAGTSFA